MYSMCHIQGVVRQTCYLFRFFIFRTCKININWVDEAVCDMGHSCIIISTSRQEISWSYFALGTTCKVMYRTVHGCYYQFVIPIKLSTNMRDIGKKLWGHSLLICLPKPVDYCMLLKFALYYINEMVCLVCSIQPYQAICWK